MKFQNKHFFASQVVACPAARPRTQGINGHVFGVPVTIHFYLFSYFWYNMDAKLSKIYYSPQGYWKRSPLLQKFPRMAQQMADTPSPLANLSSCARIHCSSRIRCAHAKRSSPGRPPFSSSRHRGGWPGPKIQIRFDRRRCGQPFQRGWTLDLERIGWGVKRFSENLQTRAFEIATATVDPGCEFEGGVTKEIEKHTSNIRGGKVDIHRDQAIVERFNRILATRLFGNQYAVEMRLPMGQRPSKWVVRLPDVVSTRLTCKKPGEAIK